MESLTSRFQREVFTPYLDLLKSRYRFHHQFGHAKGAWEEKLTADILVHGPFLEKSHSYATGDPLSSLPLHASTQDSINRRLNGRPPYKHQADALRLALDGKNVVIATGTSSGKTLCYQAPILDDLIRDSNPGLRAIIIYPLNALVNDQLTEWEELLKDHKQIRFARFSGQTPDDQKDYVQGLEQTLKRRLENSKQGQQELQRAVAKALKARLDYDENVVPNRLNHREAIRKSPPHILITNFSMLEYLLERPVDAPIFENAKLKYLVLDEVHAYRGVQATEIGFLIRRLRDRLGVPKLSCIATSATLGKRDDPQSVKKVREFASALFGDKFDEPNPIYGDSAVPELAQPAIEPAPTSYIKAVEDIRARRDPAQQFGASAGTTLSSILARDRNLYRLRKDILIRPKLLKEAADELWPNTPDAIDGLSALLEVAASARIGDTSDDFLPTRLHYFVRAEDGLHICLNPECPGRVNGRPAYFVTRNHLPDALVGDCPDCARRQMSSKLVELVSCRKCGYQYGALQDLGPRRARAEEAGVDQLKPHFDSFSTELGWAADSFWSYFSVDDELPYPEQSKDDDDDADDDDLIANPAEIPWCAICGKRRFEDEGDNCVCKIPVIRKIRIFHRQCPHFKRTKDQANLLTQEKHGLPCCPNCGARNAGLEPVRRFQESGDEVGLAMAIPLGHFAVSPDILPEKVRKLLCFTDHRQRAAAFPSLLEDECFDHDLGRKIVQVIRASGPLSLLELGAQLADIADSASQAYDPDFFLPASRKPDEQLDAKATRDLWLAEVFAYFGIPDSARESAEDIGLLSAKYRVTPDEAAQFKRALSPGIPGDAASAAALQTLLGWVRQRKIFTLPKGRVAPDAPAFGRVTRDPSLVFKRNKVPGTEGWLPHEKGDKTYNDNYVTDYLRRLLKQPPETTLAIATEVWRFLTTKHLFISTRTDEWKLDHERIFIEVSTERHICGRCGIITTYSANNICPKKGCEGTLKSTAFNQKAENLIARWVSGDPEIRFTTLKSSEHTAQIKKDIAKAIEDDFRTEGLNLLSSTTTFEMGINIGDLQKVLLRNAPPSSANYIQRIGRAGRGKNKNAVCVTMCRRTNYDSDAWKNPTLLMSGEVRTPAVFINNKIISQRHFNAVAFAQYLRIKIYHEKLLKEVKQRVRLEAFLSLESRRGVPTKWSQVEPGIYLDFLTWVTPQAENSLFFSAAGAGIVSAVGGFEAGKKAALKDYSDTIVKLGSELGALLTEGDRIYKAGGHVADIQRSIKDLLGSDVINVLAKEGFLPRYAFPLDVVSLETGATRWSRDSDVELSRDRGIAIAEFAPGGQVIAHKRVFTSAGLYIVGASDLPVRHWFSKCSNCDQIRTSAISKDSLKGNCDVCQKEISGQDIKLFIQPNAFSVAVNPKGESGERYRRGTLVRQRQTVTQFIDSIKDDLFTDAGLFKLATKDNGKLFRYNQGPRRMGFTLCSSCGASQPQATAKAAKKHKRLRVFSHSNTCEKIPWQNVSFGHEFESYCLIARPQVHPTSVESLAYALQRGICKVLDVETHDIGVSWRWLGQKNASPRAEIVLYDLTPGGAGFVKEALERWKEVVVAAKVLCAKCSCAKACYDCLKSYSNQAYHEKLDRTGIPDFLGTP